MRRSELEHAIRAACTIIDRREVVVIGSQSVLGTWCEDDLPARATLSNEADIMAPDEDPAVVRHLADVLDGAAGEFSLFHQTHGYYIDGVDLGTAVLAVGWRERLVAVCNANTRGYTGWCLDPHDLCIAKLAAYRSKDREFVAAMIEAHLIDPQIVGSWCERGGISDGVAESIVGWLGHYG